jgi:biopolymer transport protein ExbD
MADTIFTDTSPWGDDTLTLDLTPMLDVLFMLLVFFVLTANSAQQVMDVVLPQSQTETAQPPAQQAIVIEIAHGATPWHFDNQAFSTWADAAAHLQTVLTAHPAIPIIIAGDAKAHWDHVLKVMTYLTQAGRPAAQILMDPAAPS